MRRDEDIIWEKRREKVIDVGVGGKKIRTRYRYVCALCVLPH